MGNPCEVSSTVSLKTSHYSSWWFYLLQCPSTSFFWEQRFWFTKQELRQAVCTTPPLALNVTALVAQTPEGTFQSRQCQPTVLPSIGHLWFLLPWKIVLVPRVCLARHQASIGLQTALQQSLQSYPGSWRPLKSAASCILLSWTHWCMAKGGGMSGGGQKGWWPAEVWPRYLALGEMGKTKLVKCWVFYLLCYQVSLHPLEKKKNMCCFSFDRWTWLLAFWFLTNLYPKME